MSVKTNASRNREEFEVLQQCRTTVSIKPQESNLSEAIEGRLLDLSRGWAKLSIPAFLKFNDRFELRLAAPQVGFDVRVDAQVCRIRKGDGNCWTVVCSFLPTVSEKVLEELAESGAVERRREARQPVCIPATARWQLQATPTLVEVRDYSSGGFCMEGRKLGALREQVLLQMDLDQEPVDVSGRVQWQFETKGRQMAGCAFTSMEDYQRLKRVVKHYADGTSDPSTPGGSVKRIWRPVTTLASFLRSPDE